MEQGIMEQLNPVQGNSKKVIYEFSVALFEFRNILECAQLITLKGIDIIISHNRYN